MKTLALALALALSTSGCAQLAQFTDTLGPTRPIPLNVQLRGANLVHHPSDETLAMYLCPMVAGTLICRALGPVPTADRVKFVFDVVLDVQNPNPMPLPAVEALVGFTAWPDAPRQQSKVGAVCVALCPANEWCGPPPADGCSGGNEPMIKTREDFAYAAAGFLIATATGQVKPSDLRVRTIPANETVQVKIRLELPPEQFARFILSMSREAIDQVKRARIPSFAIPYMLEGSFWIRVENFGKIGSAFGPIKSDWRL